MAASATAAALEARLVPFRPQVQRHILAMVRDAAEAEELTQETYARAFERIAQLRDPQAALAWLYRIATTVSLDRLRKRRPLTIPLSGEEADGVGVASRDRQPSLLDALEQSEMSECVQGYLAGLPDNYRIAILLHDAHGISNPEIAELLGCSLATAKIRVHRARARLRETLSTACNFEIDDRGVLVCEPTEPAAVPSSAASSGIRVAGSRNQGARSGTLPDVSAGAQRQTRRMSARCAPASSKEVTLYPLGSRRRPAGEETERRT
jgi:RNA polymerase sigma-70 factor, ECF subfamily